MQPRGSSLRRPAGGALPGWPRATAGRRSASVEPSRPSPSGSPCYCPRTARRRRSPRSCWSFFSPARLASSSRSGPARPFRRSSCSFRCCSGSPSRRCRSWSRRATCSASSRTTFGHIGIRSACSCPSALRGMQSVPYACSHWRASLRSAGATGLSTSARSAHSSCSTGRPRLFATISPTVCPSGNSRPTLRGSTASIWRWLRLASWPPLPQSLQGTYSRH